jgi:hypothetical protein
MIDRVPAALTAALLARPLGGLTTSVTKQSLRGLMLTCLVVAGCLTSSAGSPLAAGDEKTPPKSASPVTKPAEVKPTVEIIHSNAGLLQRRRQAIAEMLEANIYYRTALNVKLVDAKLAGPHVRITRSLFSTATSEDRYYCATASMVFPYLPLPVPKTAVIRVRQAENGSEYLQATIEVNGTRYECVGKDISYFPFPELEQLRAKRRKALGKAD